jgi:phosphoglycerate dehydrogenase-like enzyme
MRDESGPLIPAQRSGWERPHVLITGTGMALALAGLLDGTAGVTARAGGAVQDGDEVVIGFQFPPGSLAGARSLRWLHMTGTGTDHLAAAGLARGVQVTTSASVPVTAVAEYAVAGLLLLVKDLTTLTDGQPARPGDWFTSAATLLDGSTVAVAGPGRIGRAILTRVAAFGARTIAVARPGAPQTAEARRTVSSAQLAEIAPLVDHLVCALPSTPATAGLISAAVLAALPRHATVVNVGRAAAIDTAALYAALTDGRLRGAFLDVHQTEPLPPDDPAWRVPRLIVSPHRAFSSPGEPRRVADVFLANLDDLRHGRVPRDWVTWDGWLGRLPRRVTDGQLDPVPDRKGAGAGVRHAAHVPDVLVHQRCGDLGQEDVVGNHDAADSHFRPHQLELVDVAILPVVDEHQVEGSLEVRKDRVGTPRLHPDVLCQAGSRHVAPQLLGLPLVHLDRDNLASGLGHGCGEPDRRVPNRATDLYDPACLECPGQHVEQSAHIRPHVQHHARCGFAGVGSAPGVQRVEFRPLAARAFLQAGQHPGGGIGRQQGTPVAGVMR